MNDMLNNIVSFALELDSALDSNVREVLAGYALDNPSFPIKFPAILSAIKIVTYNLLVLLTAASIKVITKAGGPITALLVVSLLIFAGGVFLIFLGLFQVLFVY